jgi:hypothetical protein
VVVLLVLALSLFGVVVTTHRRRLTLSATGVTLVLCGLAGAAIVVIVFGR